MASKEEILGILAGESGPMNRTVLGKRLGLPTSNFQSQLDRMEKQGLVEKNEQSEYTISEAGRQFALEAPPPEKEPPPGEATEESLKTTEYQQFIEMGKTTGVVPQALIEQTTSHIWRGGDYLDLDWVWKGLTEMGIRPDLARRWFHSWRSFLHQPIPSSVAEEVGVRSKTEGGKGAIKVEAPGKGKRDYMLDASGLPLYVGEGVGDLDHDEAVKLSALRQVALARGGTQLAQGQSATPGTMADEVVKIFNAFKETVGSQTKGKSYIVKPGEEGYMVEEVEEGKPTLVTAPEAKANPSPSFLVDSEGKVEEISPGKPVVVIKQAPPTSTIGKTFIVKQTPEGMVTEEYEPGKPIIINPPAPASGSGMSPMLPFPVMGSDGQPVYDKDGKPVYANIEPMMKWMGFQDERRRAEERHASLIGITQTAKENLPLGIKAIMAAVAEAKGEAPSGTEQKAEAPVSKPPTFSCGDCKTQFSAPPGWAGQSLKCPNPKCGREYTKEELEA